MAHLLLAIIYLAFISLGLPDALLGSAWPVMHTDLGAPLSWAGIVSVIISTGTVTSALASERVVRRLGVWLTVALSVSLTALALGGFALSSAFWMLCLWAVPYGLGAGSIDAALNNHVALHYESRHMSWLHCMWGVGAAIGPLVMGAALTGGWRWSGGYAVVCVVQVVNAALLILSRPLWRTPRRRTGGAPAPSARIDAHAEGSGAIAPADVVPEVLGLARVLTLPGALATMLAFFCYCALEQTVGLWGASYLSGARGVEPTVAASWAAAFYIGITVGRAASGFLTRLFDDVRLVRLGVLLCALGVLLVLLPAPSLVARVGLVVIGVGCAPVFPCLIHATPDRFGARRSQAIIGVQMASSYVGILVTPPLFGVLAQHTTVALLPWVAALLLAAMALLHERAVRVTSAPIA